MDDTSHGRPGVGPRRHPRRTFDRDHSRPTDTSETPFAFDGRRPPDPTPEQIEAQISFYAEYNSAIRAEREKRTRADAND